jgi:hypothetical protein
LIKILITIVGVIILASAFNRYRKGQIRLSMLAIWSLIWIGVITVANWPGSSDYLARLMGVGRGMDLVVFLSILAIFYGMYRIYVKVENLERKLTQIVREEALRSVDKDSD